MTKLNCFTWSLAVGFMTTLLFGCSEAGQLIEDEPTSLTRDAESVLSAISALTESEVIALAVQRKGTYKISENEALEKLEHYATSFSKSKQEDVQIKSSGHIQ